ncbi:MAG TPA: hypothetical protein VJ785_15170 [Anaerolineales bacterium]|nr:hypothetical protein [Anaerolineales bacterium]
MALKGQMSRTITTISFLALDLSILFCLSISGRPGNFDFRSSDFKFREFSKAALNSNTSKLLREISIKNAGNLPVVQQPSADANFVSKEKGVVTQFAAATQHGNIGLLAHNYLSGRSFLQLDIGQEVGLVYDDGKVEYFIVTEILRYQALDPKSPYSSFQNLNDKNEILTAGQMFDRAYQGTRHLTLQTCIAADGISSWGRLFVLAQPKPEYLSMDSIDIQRLP